VIRSRVPAASRRSYSLDPQTSAAEWKDARPQESPAVMAIPAAGLHCVIAKDDH
jgi:hypothetical protein